MTESDFMKQVWRPFDIVTTTSGFKGRIINVCFPTKSVRMHMPEGGAEWIKCDMIENHRSMSGATDDIATIEELHNKLMTAEEQAETMNEELKNTKATVSALKQCLNNYRQKLEKYEACFKRIRTEVEKLEY